MKWVVVIGCSLLWFLGVVYLTKIQGDIAQLEHKWWLRKLRWQRERRRKDL